MLAAETATTTATTTTTKTQQALPDQTFLSKSEDGVMKLWM